MKNKMQLIQAAQKVAAETLDVVAPLELAKLKVSSFEDLGISHEHYVEFTNFFDAARGVYQALSGQPVKPAVAAQAAA
jgi:hypothetical protein